MPDDPEPSDFFVSYARSDNAGGWITRFVEELLAEHRKFAAGRELKPFFDKHDILPGADWRHNLTHGVAHSKLFLAFLSPEYFRSEWCRRECDWSGLAAHARHSDREHSRFDFSASVGFPLLHLARTR